jgi:hypothetical protein
MGIELKSPIIIKVDNVGAIYLQTKYIDIWTHFVREFIEDGVLKVIFVKSEDNAADILGLGFLPKIQQKHYSTNIQRRM